jgi:DNA-binding cell septation regulator SpoVG
MDITEVKVTLADKGREPLLAFASVVFDGCFLVADLKVLLIEERFQVGFPSRKMCDRCPNPHCRRKCPLLDRFCGKCGAKLIGPRDGSNAFLDVHGRSLLYVDVAHPITTEFRKVVECKVVEAYHEAHQAAYQETRQDGARRLNATVPTTDLVG